MRKRSTAGRHRSRRTALVPALCATSAFARPFFGTAGDDVLSGTNRHDYIAGRDGNDTLNGLARVGRDSRRQGQRHGQCRSRARSRRSAGPAATRSTAKPETIASGCATARPTAVDCGDGLRPRAGGRQRCRGLQLRDREAPRACDRTGVFLGTPGDDVINGTERHDYIDGRDGNDTINGFGRWDVIRARQRQRHRECRRRPDFVFGSSATTR